MNDFISDDEFIKLEQQGKVKDFTDRDIVKSAGEQVGSQKRFQRTGDTAPSFGGTIMRGLTKGAFKLGTSIANAPENIKRRNAGEELKVAKSGYFGNTKPLGASGKFGKDLLDAVGTGADIGSTIATPGGFGTIAKTAGKGLVKQGLKAGLRTGATTGAAQGFGNAAQKEDASVGDIVAQILMGGVVGGGIGLATGGISGLATRAGRKTIFKNPLTSRTQQDILNTPESQLHKLSSLERDFYFKNAKNQVSEFGRKTTDTIKKDAQSKILTLQKEAEQLDRQLETASRDEVINLRPKIIQSMRKQSQEYRNIVEKELQPHADKQVSESELKMFIESRFPDDPAKAQTIKDRLGLKEIFQDAKGKTGKPSLNFGKDRTVGEIYKNVQALKQEISSGARGGSQVFTPDDKNTDDAINLLTSFLGDKGVDLSGASRFWAKYAPIRNQLVREAKPFLQTETNTKTFANTITRVLKGEDVNNENFITEVEKLVGQKIGPNVKGVLAKLDANKKAQVARKIEAQGKILEEKLARQKKLGQLDESQFEVSRKAGWRRLIKNVLLAVGIGAGATTIGGQIINANN